MRYSRSADMKLTLTWRDGGTCRKPAAPDVPQLLPQPLTAEIPGRTRASRPRSAGPAAARAPQPARQRVSHSSRPLPKAIRCPQDRNCAVRQRGWPVRTAGVSGARCHLQPGAAEGNHAPQNLDEPALALKPPQPRRTGAGSPRRSTRFSCRSRPRPSRQQAARQPPPLVPGPPPSATDQPGLARSRSRPGEERRSCPEEWRVVTDVLYPLARRGHIPPLGRTGHRVQVKC
jgi:hypothetical protein